MNIKEGAKKFFEKLWFIIWKDNSFRGWVLSIIFLFLFIKLVFFPILSLLTGTSLPLAIVESCSMYHKGNYLSNYDGWWQNHKSKYSPYNIEKDEFEDFGFKDGLNKGDILFVIGAKPEKLKVGDTIIFAANQQNPIIHRIINIKEKNDEYVFSTIGDNNNAQLNFEKNIEQEQLVGKAVFRAPYLGWVKLIFYDWKKAPSDKWLCREN